MNIEYLYINMEKFGPDTIHKSSRTVVSDVSFMSNHVYVYIQNEQYIYTIYM